MMYIDDALNGVVRLMNVDKEKIKTRTAYNIAAVNFTPYELHQSILKYYPDFKVQYITDFRQTIAESWTSSLDDSFAKNDWDWNYHFDLDKMTRIMIENLKIKYRRNE